MAEVYVARMAGPNVSGKRLAIKRILPQLARDSRFLAMFCDEARICASLSHPNIVQVVDFGEQDGELYMVMEYVDGVSCAKLLRSVAARSQQFPLASAFFIAHEVLSGLDFVHSALDEQGRPLGLVHRDVSPGNILIGRSGEVKLTDFGIVRSEFVARRTYPGELKGKLGYMAPEQVIGEDVSPRTDLFTVGIVLAEMLLTRPLFSGQNEIEILTRIHDADLRVLRSYGGHLPPVIHDLLHTALAREPSERFGSAEVFLEALRSVASDCGVSIGDEEFMPWLWNLGIIPSQSGTREAVRQVEPLPKAGRDVIRRARAAAVSLARAGDTGPTVPPPTALPRTAPSTYQLLTQHGACIGPMKLSELLEMMMTGRVAMDALVSENGRDFQPLGGLPELAAYANHPGYRFRDNLADQAAWSRRVERRTLPSLLYRITAARETGLLVARAGRREKRLFFKAGEPRFVSSTDRSELLGARLIEARLVTAAQVEEALLASALRGDRRLGESMVVAGAISATDLVRALVEQLEAAIVELGTWNEGELWFVRGQDCPDSVPRAVHSGVELVTRAVRGGYSGSELVQLLAHVYKQPVRRSAGAALGVAALGLSSPELEAMERAPSAPTIERLVGQVAAAGAAARDDALRAVFIGLSCGLLEAPGWVKPATG